MLLTHLRPFVPYLTPPALVLGWLAFLAIMASGGWSALARHYRVSAEQKAQSSNALNGRVYDFDGLELLPSGGLPLLYNNLATLAVRDDGILLVSALPLFRPFHPPLLIPWSAIAQCRAEDDGLTLQWTAVELRTPVRFVLRMRGAGGRDAATRYATNHNTAA